MKLTDTETILLMELYTKSECLWNRNDPCYKNKLVRHAAYGYIVSKMSIPDFDITELKLKIKNIRSAYGHLMTKIDKSKKSGGDIYIPTVKWFDSFNSIMQRIKISRSAPCHIETGVAKVCHTVCVAQDSDSDCVEIQSSDHGNTGISENEKNEMTPSASEIPVFPATWVSAQPAPSYPPGRLGRSRGRKRQPGDDGGDDGGAVDGAVRPRRRRRVGLHDGGHTLEAGTAGSRAEAFGQHVAMCLNRLPRHEADEAEADIQTVLTRYILRAMGYLPSN